MKRAGRARRALIVSMCPPDTMVIDVGADHGHVAHAVGGIATELEPHRAGRRDVPWVVCDGLSAFGRVPAAVIAGMGAHTILGILDRGPRPDVLITHAPDDPGTLREGLAARGWRIDAEGLAPEGTRWAEVIRVLPGDEPATGLTLHFGPLLLRGGDPHLVAHLTHHAAYWRQLAAVTAHTGEPKHEEATRKAAFLEASLARLSAP